MYSFIILFIVLFTPNIFAQNNRNNIPIEKAFYGRWISNDGSVWIFDKKGTCEFSINNNSLYGNINIESIEGNKIIIKITDLAELPGYFKFKFNFSADKNSSQSSLQFITSSQTGNASEFTLKYNGNGYSNTDFKEQSNNPKETINSTSTSTNDKLLEINCENKSITTNFKCYHFKKEYLDKSKIVVQFDRKFPQMINYSNKSVENAVNKKVLELLELSSLTNSAFEASAKVIIDSYNDFKADADPEFLENTTFEDILTISITYYNNYILSLSEFTSYATGGAHPNYGENHIILNMADGSLIKLNDIFDSAQLPKIRELLLKELKKREITEESIKDFTDGKDLEISENISITNDSIFFTYNPYEIASFADGIITIPIPLNNISRMMKNGSPLSKMVSKKENYQKNITEQEINKTSPFFVFKAFDGYYFGIGQNQNVHFLDNEAKNANKFELVSVGNNQFFIKASNGKYLSIESGSLYANKNETKDAEKFVIVKESDGKFSIKTSNGKYIRAAKTFLTSSLLADRDKAGKQEKYEIIEYKK